MSSSKQKDMAIIAYSIIHLQKKDKIRFYYALKGRDGKSGIVKSLKIRQLGRAVLLVPEKSRKEAAEFLKYWGCKFSEIEVVVKK